MSVWGLLLLWIEATLKPVMRVPFASMFLEEVNGKWECGRCVWEVGGEVGSVRKIW